MKKKAEAIAKNELNKTETEDKLRDLSVATEQAEEAKGGSISLNYTKILVRTDGMGSPNG